jgi:hypothetical protein
MQQPCELPNRMVSSIWYLVTHMGSLQATYVICPAVSRVDESRKCTPTSRVQYPYYQAEPSHHVNPCAKMILGHIRWKFWCKTFHPGLFSSYAHSKWACDEERIICVTPSRDRNGLGSQVIHQIIMVTSVKLNCLAKMAVHKKGCQWYWPSFSVNIAIASGKATETQDADCV